MLDLSLVCPRETLDASSWGTSLLFSTDGLPTGFVHLMTALLTFFMHVLTALTFSTTYLQWAVGGAVGAATKAV